ncbi:MAG: hypothetical protein ACR2K0_00215 [Acidimicrobiales bacterium]
MAAVAAASVAFAAGLAAWHEDLLAGDRFGGGWRRYRASVRTWRPRWQPYVEADAVLYVAAGCEPCSTVGAWLQRRRPVGLRLRAAENRAGPGLRRITYVAADGTTASGIAAVAHALEHLHLGWAITGWALRLPGVGLLAHGRLPAEDGALVVKALARAGHWWLWISLPRKTRPQAAPPPTSAGLSSHRGSRRQG